MKHFGIDSAPIALPADPEEEPVRLLRVGWKGRPVTGVCQSARRCYVYPVLTPSGVGVTSERPEDHPFHQSITVGNDYFFTCRTSAAGRFEDPGMCFYTDGPDMRGRGEGRIVAAAHNECTELGGDRLEIILRTQWQGPEEGYSPKYRRVVAEEMRTIGVRPGEGANLIDVRSELRPTDRDIRLGPSRHGYFTIRVADHLRVVNRRRRKDERRARRLRGPLRRGGRLAARRLDRLLRHRPAGAHCRHRRISVPFPRQRCLVRGHLRQHPGQSLPQGGDVGQPRRGRRSSPSASSPTTATPSRPGCRSCTRLLSRGPDDCCRPCPGPVRR